MRGIFIGAAAILVAPLAGCTDTCAAGDDTCILAHLRVTDGDSRPVALTSVPGSAVTPLWRTNGSGASVGSGAGMQGTGNGGALTTQVPAVTGLPQTLTFLDAANVAMITVSFTDPCGARPAGCFGVHHGTRFPSSPWMTTGPIIDGATDGTWSFQLGFDYASSRGDSFTVDFIPWSPCPVSDDPIKMLLAGKNVALGAMTEIVAQVSAAGGGGNAGSAGSGGGGSAGSGGGGNGGNGGGGGGGGGFGGSCVSPTVPSSVMGGGCCSTGVCPASCSNGSQSWYEVGGQEFGPCSANDSGCLQSAAQGALQACGIS